MWCAAAAVDRQRALIGQARRVQLLHRRTNRRTRSLYEAIKILSRIFYFFFLRSVAVYNMYLLSTEHIIICTTHECCEQTLQFAYKNIKYNGSVESSVCQAFTPQLLNDFQRKQSTTLLGWLVGVCAKRSRVFTWIVRTRFQCSVFAVCDALLYRQLFSFVVHSHSNVHLICVRHLECENN